MGLHDRDAGGRFRTIVPPAACLAVLSAALAGLFALPSGQVPGWALGSFGALLVYGLGAAWACAAIWLVDRVLRARPDRGGA